MLKCEAFCDENWTAPSLERQDMALQTGSAAFTLTKRTCHDGDKAYLSLSRVMAQVSCEVTEPKQTRPTEGVLFVHVELSPMAAPHFEAGRLAPRDYDKFDSFPHHDKDLKYGVEFARVQEASLW